MIYLVCPVCGFAIDIFTSEEANTPVRAKRMKYLLTRDQVCPNCINTIGRCKKVEEDESKIPILKVEVGDSDKSKFLAYCKGKGYAVATDYALKEFKSGN